jgi:hypothetical protein
MSDKLSCLASSSKAFKLPNSACICQHEAHEMTLRKASFLRKTETPPAIASWWREIRHGQ